MQVYTTCMQSVNAKQLSKEPVDEVRKNAGELGTIVRLPRNHPRQTSRPPRRI